jgi:hypothetical protein
MIEKDMGKQIMASTMIERDMGKQIMAFNTLKYPYLSIQYV